MAVRRRKGVNTRIMLMCRVTRAADGGSTRFSLCCRAPRAGPGPGPPALFHDVLDHKIAGLSCTSAHGGIFMPLNWCHMPRTVIVDTVAVRGALAATHGSLQSWIAARRSDAPRSSMRRCKIVPRRAAGASTKHAPFARVAESTAACARVITARRTGSGHNRRVDGANRRATPE